MTLTVTPRFTSYPRCNELLLLDLARIAHEEALPVARFVIESGSSRGDFGADTPDMRLTATLLFYWMTLTGGHPMFHVTPEMQSQLKPYYGPYLLRLALRPGTTLKPIVLLLGDMPLVQLTLQSGYEQYVTKERLAEDVIRQAWARRAAIQPGAPEPLLRQTIGDLNRALSAGEIRARTDGPSDAWFSDVWEARVEMLTQSLHH